MTELRYPHLSLNRLEGVLNSLVTPGETQGVFQALTDAGLIKNAHSRVTLDYFYDTGLTTKVEPNTQVVVLGPNTETVVESHQPLVITASSGDNYIDVTLGKQVADTILAGSGTDTIIGNSARDLLEGGSGNASIVSGGGFDTLAAGAGRDTLVGGGHSLIFAEQGTSVKASGSDMVVGGSGADTIRAAGHSLVYSQNSGDLIEASGQATIVGSNHRVIPIGGMDSVFGGRAGGDTVSAHQGHQTIEMGRGSLKLEISGSANDSIFGSAHSGALKVDKASTDVASETTNSKTGVTTIHFTAGSGGGTINVHNVTVDFTDKKTFSS